MPENIVLYRRTGENRHPLFSTDTGDANASAKILAKMGVEFHRAEHSGAPIPELEVILEATATDKETGKALGDTTYTLLDSVTLKPKGKSARTLDGVSADKGKDK